jgi:hypothetical protein
MRSLHATLNVGRLRPLHRPTARLAGAASLILWIGVVACGRWIGFTVHRFALKYDKITTQSENNNEKLDWRTGGGGSARK